MKINYTAKTFDELNIDRTYAKKCHDGDVVRFFDVNKGGHTIREYDIEYKELSDNITKQLDGYNMVKLCSSKTTN